MHTLAINRLKIRLLILSILPSLVLLPAIIFYFFQIQQISQQQIQDLSGHNIAQQLAIQFMNHSLTAIKVTLPDTLTQQKIKKINILSKQGMVLSYPESLEIDNSFHRYEADIIQSNSEISASSPIKLHIYLPQIEYHFFVQHPTFGIILLFLSGLLLLGLSITLSRKILTPLQHLSIAVEKMKQGNFATRINEVAKNELSHLNEGFNSMAIALEDAQERMQEQIDQATNDLTETMEELEIKNVELDLARKRAQKASQAKTEFLANMSHEIRTPMHGVIGFTKLLSETPLNSQQHNLVHTISKSANELLNIINDILDYSKLEYGRVEPSLNPFSVRRCFEEAISLLSPLAHDKGLELVLLIYQDVPDPLIGDDARIRQIIINLLSNAIKFTDTGDIIVRVMLEDETDTHCLLAFSISDTGIGISQATQKNLFRSFSQVDVSINRRYGGTGLGLSICRRLLQAMKGNIQVHSELGKGSQFNVSIPLEKNPNPTALPTKALSLQPSCLLIEDHTIARSAINHALASFGIVVTCLSHQDMPQPENILQDIIIIAYEYKHLLHPSLERELKYFTSNMHKPILFLHSSSDRFIIDQLEKLTQSSWMTKPIQNDTLRYCIETLLLTPQHTSNILGYLTPPESNQFLTDKHFLVVDDNSVNLELISQVLKDKGATITPASEGKTAVEKAKNGLFDAIFMDIHMPVMSGIEASQLIRDFEQGAAQTPIIALTADIMPDTHQQALAAGMDRVLIKPIEPNKLWQTLQEMLHLSSASPMTRVESAIPRHSTSSHSYNTRPLTSRDNQTALNITGGNQQLATDMYETFLSELEDDMKAINLAEKTKHWDKLSQLSHRLLGSTSVCGIHKLEYLLRQLEGYIATQNTQKISNILLEIKAEARVLLNKGLGRN